MAEPMVLPGAPQIVVTRGWAYQFFTKTLGYNPSERGFGSVDYMVFGRSIATERCLPLDTPLTDLTEPWAAGILKAIERDCAVSA